MKREKIFNLPGVVTALIAILTIIQIAVDLFPRSVGVWTLVYFSFIPARLSFLVAPNQVLHALADVDADELADFLNTARFAWCWRRSALRSRGVLDRCVFLASSR